MGRREGNEHLGLFQPARVVEDAHLALLRELVLEHCLVFQQGADAAGLQLADIGAERGLAGGDLNPLAVLGIGLGVGVEVFRVAVVLDHPDRHPRQRIDPGILPGVPLLHREHRAADAQWCARKYEIRRVVAGRADDAAELAAAGFLDGPRPGHVGILHGMTGLAQHLLGDLDHEARLVRAGLTVVGAPLVGDQGDGLGIGVGRGQQQSQGNRGGTKGGSRERHADSSCGRERGLAGPRPQAREGDKADG
jgi:hypothetical protein